MSDTHFNVIPSYELSYDKDFLVEDGKIVDITKHSRQFNFPLPVCLTRPLFSEIYPVAEELQNHESATNRYEDLCKLFKKLPEYQTSNYLEFYFTFSSRLKEYVSPVEIHLYKTPRDRRIKCFATTIMDNRKQQPNILFGLSN